jgi:DNA polymerase III subunit epsilon
VSSSTQPGARYVAFDLETTGLIAGVDRIVELGAVLFEEDQVLDTWDQLVDPGIPMPAAAGRVNGITDDMLAGKPRIEDVLPGFLSFLGRGTPVAHNACFDVGFLCAAMDQAGCTPPPGPVLDTRGLAKRAFPGRFSYSLANLSRDYRLEVSGAHRALADAHTCRLLFLLCGETAPARSGACGPPLDFTENAPQGPRTAALLKKAMDHEGLVDIEYRSTRGELSARTIKPLSFSTMGGALVVNAFCGLRNMERTFRLDSILAARPAGASAP